MKDIIPVHEKPLTYSVWEQRPGIWINKSFSWSINRLRRITAEERPNCSRLVRHNRSYCIACTAAIHYLKYTIWTQHCYLRRRTIKKKLSSIKYQCFGIMLFHMVLDGMTETTVKPGTFHIARKALFNNVRAHSINSVVTFQF